MANETPTRAEVPEAATWDLTTIFEDDAAWEAAVKKLEQELTEADQIADQLLNSGADLYAGLQYGLNVMRQLEKIYVYASLKSDQDTNNAYYQGLNTRSEGLAARVASAIAFFDPAVLTLSPAELQAFFQAEPRLAPYEHYFDAILQQKGHVLDRESEELLAGASEVLNASQTTFNILDNADLDFGWTINEEGEEEHLTNGVYSRLLESTQPEVRRMAFKKFYQPYEQFRNTFSTLLSGNVKQHNYLARVHHYYSARSAALAQNFIPEAVYDNLIDETHRALPLLQRYVKLRKRLLNLDSLHSYDLYTPIMGDPDYYIDYPSAQAKALEALAPLGDEYLDVVQRAFDERWIDVVENQGKRSGAYSGGMYDTNPFILLNWVDNLNNLYTLVHEMGHSVHSYETRQNQPYQYGDYPIFLAEIASTTNENLLTEHLLKTESDPYLRAYILNQYLDGVKGTVFRQTQFAEFEQHVHELDAAGVPLTADTLDEYYAALNHNYYGDALTKDPEIAYEWARIPHFYYDFYVFQYATGFAAATALSQNILAPGDGGVKAYFNYLQAGSSAYPLDVMRQAGVDMEKTDYLQATFKLFEQRLDEFEVLIETLTNEK